MRNKAATEEGRRAIYHSAGSLCRQRTVQRAITAIHHQRCMASFKAFTDGLVDQKIRYVIGDNCVGVSDNRIL